MWLSSFTSGTPLVTNWSHNERASDGYLLGFGSNLGFKNYQVPL